MEILTKLRNICSIMATIGWGQVKKTCPNCNSVLYVDNNHSGEAGRGIELIKEVAMYYILKDGEFYGPDKNDDELNIVNDEVFTLLNKLALIEEQFKEISSITSFLRGKERNHSA